MADNIAYWTIVFLRAIVLTLLSTVSNRDTDPRLRRPSDSGSTKKSDVASVSDWTLYEQRRVLGWTEIGRPPPPQPAWVDTVRSLRDRGRAMPGSRERILAPGADVDGEVSFQSPLDRRLLHSGLPQPSHLTLTSRPNAPNLARKTDF